MVSNETAYRIARQTENVARVGILYPSSKPDRFPGFDCNFVKDLLDATIGQYFGYEIKHARRDTTG